MNIGLVSYEFVNKDLFFNLKQIEKAMLALKDKVDLLCFGESFLQGFDCLSWNYDIDKRMAINQNSSTMNKLKDLTLTYNVDLLFGYIEEDQDVLYSSCALIEKGEIIHNYRRISTGWKEEIADNHYQEGNNTDEFYYQGQKFKVALCGDLWEYPERFKTDGILLWPVYVSFSLDEWADEEKEYAKQAKEAADLTLMINSISKDVVSHGGAFIFKDGELINDVIYDVENITILGV